MVVSTNAVEMHAALCDAGWRVDLDGKWISPNPNDARFTFTIHAAWREYRRAQLVADVLAPKDRDDPA